MRVSDTIHCDRKTNLITGRIVIYAETKKEEITLRRLMVLLPNTIDHSPLYLDLSDPCPFELLKLNGIKYKKGDRYALVLAAPRRK